MLLIIAGPERNITAVIDRLVPVSKGQPVRNIESEQGSAVVEELLSTESLFGGNETIIVSEPVTEEWVTAEEIKSWATRMQASGHLWCLADSSWKKIPKELQAAANHTHTAAPTTKKTTFNIFALTDVLLMADRKKLWLAYQKAIMAGVTAEEMIPVFWWQLKTMAMVAATPGKNPGLAPFVYQKVNRSLNKLPLAKLQVLMTGLLQVLARGREESMVAERFEQWILEI